MARKPRLRTRRSTTIASLDAVRIEGALLQPETVARIVDLAASEQSEADYGLDPKEKLRDVVQTKFALAQSLFARFVGSDRGSQATRRFLSTFFSQVLEFSDLAETAPVVIEGRTYPIGRHALGGRAPIVLAPAGKIDEADKAFGDGGRRRSPAQLLQEYLNAVDSALWGIVCDGVRLRLYRDNAALTRPAFIEADLERIFDPDAPLMADFVALWLIAHASRLDHLRTARLQARIRTRRGKTGLKARAPSRRRIPRSNTGAKTVASKAPRRANTCVTASNKRSSNWAAAFSNILPTQRSRRKCAKASFRRKPICKRCFA